MLRQVIIGRSSRKQDRNVTTAEKRGLIEVIINGSCSDYAMWDIESYLVHSFEQSCHLIYICTVRFYSLKWSYEKYYHH